MLVYFPDLGSENATGGEFRATCAVIPADRHCRWSPAVPVVLSAAVAPVVLPALVFAWTAICDDIPLALESNSFDALIEKVKVCAAEMLELNAAATPARLCIKSERWESIA